MHIVGSLVSDYQPLGPSTRTLQTVGFGMQLQNATLELTFGEYAPGA
jgi:hypothetical protein